MTDTGGCVELWSHAFTMVCDDDCGVQATLYAHESPEHPEQLVARLAAEVPGFMGCVCMSCNKLGVLRYVRSWNHEPSEAEKVAAGLDAWDDDEPAHTGRRP